LALGAQNVGWTERDFFDAIMDKRHRAGEKIWHRRDARLRGCLLGQGVEEGAGQPVDSGSRRRAGEDRRGPAGGRLTPVDRQSGTTDKILMNVLCDIADACGKITFHADVRTPLG
jgi:hypothetical protein